MNCKKLVGSIVILLFIGSPVWALGSSTIDSHLIPKVDNTVDIGSSSKELKDIYVDGIGYFEQLSFDEISHPGNPASNTGYLYVIDAGGDVSTLYFKDKAGTQTDLLAAGANTLSGLTDTVIDTPSSGHILIYDGTNSWDNKEVTGDIAITNAGIVTVTDLTITSETGGDVLYFDGSSWVRLAKGSDGQFLKIGASIPAWDTVVTAQASSLANSATLDDAGANDAILSFTQQTTSAPTLTIPNFNGSNDTFAFIGATQILTDKTLTAPDINAGTVDAITSLTVANNVDIGAYSLQALIFVSDQTTGTAPFTVASTTVVANLNADTVDAKSATDFVLVDGSQALSANWDVGAYKVTALTFESDQTTGTAPFIVASTTVVANLNVDQVDGKDAPTGDFVGHTDSQTLTNKTIDVDSNVVSNINADETDPVTVPTDAAPAFVSSVPFVLSIDITDAVTTTITSNAPFNFRIIDVWSINTSADGGTWKLYTGAADITDVVTVAGSNEDIDRASTIADNTAIISATGTLQVVTDGGLDAQIYILCIRTD